MVWFVISKKRLSSFLTAIAKDYELIAPVKDEVVRFTAIKHPDEIYLEKNAYFPLKEYFFKPKETLFQFDGKKFVQPDLKTPPRAFFGIRKCDLNAIKHQDMVFAEQVQDPYYQAARSNSLLLGYHCNTAPSKYCFCGTLNLVDFFDLMFFDEGKEFLVEVGSDKGAELIKKHKRFFSATTKSKTAEDKKIPGSERLEIDDISELYDHPDWKKGVDICLSCGACTALCPTCYCFSIHDENHADNPKTSSRVREWSSCQVPEFTKVAGDHVFREDREQRFKHRIYHQLEYFKEKNNVPLCVGCGRCISGCPTRIDFVDIINGMNNGTKNKTKT